MRSKREEIVILIALVLLLPGIFLQGAGASGEKTIVQSQSPYGQLYEILTMLDFTGWEVVKQGLYVSESGKYIQVLSPAKTASASASSPSARLFQSRSLKPGQEGILKECGCHAIAQKVFKRGNRYVTFEGFQFDKAIGANAGYNFLRSGSTTVLTRGDGSSEDGESISFWQNNFFFHIFTTEEDDSEAKSVVSDIANRINKVVVQHAGPILVMKSLPALDRVKGSEKIVRGPLIASHYFSVPFIKELGIELARGAAVADYQVYYPHRERLKVLYIDYGDPVLAQRAYVSFATNISQLQPPLSGSPQSSPRCVFKLNKRFLLCELKPRGRIVVISGARKKDSAGILASHI